MSSTLPEGKKLVQANHRTGRPPIPTAKQPHCRRDKQGAHDGCVHHNGNAHSDAHRLDDRQVGEPEGEEHQSHDRRSSGNHPAGTFQTPRHRSGVIAYLLVLLAHPAEQQHLVVHREAKQDAKHDDRSHWLDGTRREVEPRGQMTVLKDPDQGAVGGADGQHVHQHGLEGEQ